MIDVAFAQVRPSPWRQAVDLANMMLVLAVRTDAERVYRRALRYFTPDEIAEAFAAARGIASPTQLRTVMKQDGRDLVAQFRAHGAGAPADLAAALGRRGACSWPRLAASASSRRSCNVYGMFTPAELPIGERADVRHRATSMILMAQAVPTATAVPVRRRAAGRLDGRRRARRGGATPGSGSTPTRPAATPSR